MSVLNRSNSWADSGSGAATHHREISQSIEPVARRLAVTSCTVLLTGETGVGKGHVARWIHEHGERVSRPMIPVNCGAIPEGVIDSHLFGHARGAYTGADRAHSGLIRAADGGTLLLDEVSELPATAQIRLLRLLEEREVLPVGSAQPQRVDVRIIAATNANLLQRMRDGRFRADLYYRLNVIELEIQPLRDRPQEILPLFQQFNEEFAGIYQQAELRMSDEAGRAMLSYDWPGNVRELRIVAERLHVLCPDGLVAIDELRRCGQVPTWPAVSRAIVDADPRLSLVGCRQPRELPRRMQEARMAAAREALQECGGNISIAAKSIGVHRSTLYRWLQGDAA